MNESTPFVGRASELRRVLQALEDVTSTAEPRALTVVGPAGIGKTRMMSEIVRQVRGRARVFRAAGRPDSAALGIVEGVLKSRFAVSTGSAPEAVRAAAADAFGDRQIDEILHFLGGFVGIDFPESPFLKAFEGESPERHHMGRVVLRRFFEADARRFGPTIFVLEDLHHAPADTLDLVQHLIRTLSGAPILILGTCRPELLTRRPGWAAERPERHTLAQVPPLSVDDARRLTVALLGVDDPVPSALVDAAVQVAGGSPYLLEQVIPAFAEAGVLTMREGGGVSVNVHRLDAAKLPLSVDDAIATRISSLGGDARQILEMAATMGSVFWFGALVALRRLGSETPELWGGVASATDHIRDTLDSLVARNYVVPVPTSSIPGEVEYTFKHNVEREAVLEQLPANRAVSFHRVVGEWLEFRLAERAEEHCELLAHHFEEAGLGLKAAVYSLRAADRARARFANTKSAEHYARGLDLLEAADRLVRLDALHHYGDVLQLAGRNDEALDVFREMLDIAYQLDLRGKGGAAHNRIGRLYRAIGRLDEAMRHLGTGYALFEAAGDARGVASSLDDVGKVHWMRGVYADAERFMRAALERRQELGDQRSIALSFNNLGLVFQDSGRFDEARVHFQEALLLRQAIDDPPGISQTLNNLGSVAQDSGDHARAAELYRQALRVAEETGDRMRQAVILTNLGETQYRLGDPSGAITVLEQAGAIAANLGDRILEGEILRGLAKASLLVGERPRARDHIRRSVALFESARSLAFLGTALRTLAEIEAASVDRGSLPHQRVREAFERSVAVLEQVGNEPELAATCRAFAEFLERESGHDDERTDATGAGGRARQLRAQARIIENRLQSSTPPGFPGDATQAGSSLG